MHTAFLQLLNVQNEYAEMTFDPDPRNAPSSLPRPLSPNTAPSVASESATQSQLNAHQQSFIQPADDWLEPVMSQGSLKAESVVMETEKDKTLHKSALTQMPTDNPILEVTSQKLAPSPVTSDPLTPVSTSPLPVPLSGSCQNAKQTSQQRPDNVHSQAGDTAAAAPQLAVSTAALISLFLRLCPNTAV